MCLTLFVAANKALPIIPFCSATPAFWSEAVGPEALAVRRHLTNPFVYSLGSHQECSCGFSYADDATALDSATDIPEQVKADWRSDCGARAASVEQLRQYLRLGLEAGPVEVYSCWYGEWEAEPLATHTVGLEHFGGRSFRIVERERLLVTR